MHEVHLAVAWRQEGDVERPAEGERALTNDLGLSALASRQADEAAAERLRGLDLETGAIKQYTDVFGGAMAPAPVQGPQGERLAFITYFKGEYKLHTQDTAEPVKEIDQEVRAASEGIVDFQPDIAH